MHEKLKKTFLFCFVKGKTKTSRTKLQIYLSYNTYVRFIVSSFANRFGDGSLSKSIRLLL